LFQPLRTVVVPYANFWPMQRNLTGGNLTVPCPPVPNRQRIDWWHRQTGYSEYDEAAGAGIKVGVIDTGFGPHGHLNGTPVGAFIDNQFDPNGGADVDEHGTHVAGTIGGRPGQALRFSGMAPGVELFAARVFSGLPGTGAGNPDIAAAIDFLSRDKKCDLINMSLGAPIKSSIIEDAIKDAFERGTLCICAAANSAGPVNFPAAFPDAVAISAAGQLGNAPEGSVSASREPTDQSLFGINHLFFANFSCFGPQIDSIAPGVGIVAPIPERNGFELPYGALDGTSMASPVACGTLARALAKHPNYTSMSRDMHRATLARSVLTSISKSIGLDAIHQGHGIPVE
jgi:subtilisin